MLARTASSCRGASRSMQNAMIRPMSLLTAKAMTGYFVAQRANKTTSSNSTSSTSSSGADQFPWAWTFAASMLSAAALSGASSDFDIYKSDAKLASNQASAFTNIRDFRDNYCLNTLSKALGGNMVHAAAAIPDAIFTREEVAKHTTPETGIWVIYKDGVYDITEFIEQHPGGAKRILMAKGSNIDPFWNMYQQHLTPEVAAVLEPLRIGSLDPNEALPEFDESDPYAKEPVRHPALLVRKSKPFNAETPVDLIADNYITSNELWYCRHHHPVPHIDPEKFCLGFLRETSRKPTSEGGEPTDATYEPVSVEGGLSLAKLKSKYPKHTITATMQCGGNRRAALNAHGKTQGLAWDVGAISTASWGGARLRDVLADQYGIRTLKDAEKMGVKHVHFLPFDPPYDASIPIEKALDERMDVILAYEMNGVDIPPEHGYPVRVIVPGGIGARNVKWCQTIRVASEESDSVWQRNVQYKGFSPNVKKFDSSVDVQGALSVQEMPVQSAVTVCPDEVEADDEEVEVQGYAWSGGGRNIVRVDVTSDGELKSFFF